jgi:hypothetical protein
MTGLDTYPEPNINIFLCSGLIFYNISAISWRSVLLMEETGKKHLPVTDKFYHILLYRVHLTMNRVRTHNF